MANAMKNLFAAYVIYKSLKKVNDYSKLNGLFLPGGNMGISRSQMPQIHDQYLNEFLAHMKREGIKFKETFLPTADLKLTQNEYNKEKVLKLMDKIGKLDRKTLSPIYISSDHFVLDGSHRFIALHNLDPHGSIKALQANAKILDVLEAARSFGGSVYRSISDNKVVQ